MPSDPSPSLTEKLANIHTGGEDTDSLIIGLDFGTTYSGIAYAFSTQPDKVYTIDEYEGAKGRKPPKVPTVIKYDPKNTKKFQWGYELDSTTAEKIEGIKLLLDPDQPKPLYVPPSNVKAELARIKKPPIEVATDYIAAIYRHALGKIEGKYPKAYLQMLEKKFVLTVPAVWSDKAKDSTLRAARQAGISPITLIKEPEAAALFTLHFLKNKGLKVGDAFVLCDAGGGTVDLISYEITNLVPLELKELVPGKGGLAGSMMLNKRFEEHIKNILGDEQFLNLKKNNSNAFRLAMKQFDESIKTAFMSRDEEYYVNFPKANLKDDLSNNISSNCLTLTGDVLHDIFQPLITDIKNLVDEQVRLVQIKRLQEHHGKADEIKAIFLVGGFGSSTYLKECLTNAHPTIQVIQPDNAWSAIVQGAVLSKLPHEATVVSSVATKHYGVSANEPFDEIVDKNETKHWDEYDRIWRVPKMTWYIYEGDDLMRDRKIAFPFFRQIPADTDPNDLVFVTELKESVVAKPPSYPKLGLVKANCSVRSDLRDVPKTEFKKKRTTDNKEYWEVHYQLMVTIESASMTFSLDFQGKTFGKAEADYR